MDIEREDNVFKASIPAITDDEIRAIDNNFDEIAHKFSETIMHDKDLIVAQRVIQNLRAEINKKDKIINQMVIYIMTHSSVPTLRHRFCPNYEREECKYNCDDTKVKSKCIIEYFTKKVEESEK